MKSICLTGGIASGKSTVAGMLAARGAQVENADEVGRQVSLRPEVRRALTRALGRSFYTRAGELKSAEMAAYIFHHPDARSRVNDIIHPEVWAELQRRYEAVQDRPGCFVVESALAVETGYADTFEVIVVVTAPRSERLRRLIEEKGMSADQAVARMGAQMPQQEKARRADYVLDNSGNRQELEARVHALYRRLCAHDE